MAVITDKRIALAGGGYGAEVVSANDYYVFGGQVNGRVWALSDAYRYGFNGKENDNEVKGEGNQQDYGMRIYDPRLGRFLSVDPLTKDYSYYTPYQFAGNSPIAFVDIDGLEPGPPPSAMYSMNKGLYNGTVSGKEALIKLATATDVNDATVLTHGLQEEVMQ